MVRSIIIISAILVSLVSAQTQSTTYTKDDLTAGFAAKALASGIFISERDQQDIIENTVMPMVSNYYGYSRDDLHEITVDSAKKSVTIQIASSSPRTARCYGTQGCILLPKGHDGVFFDPELIIPQGPDPAMTPWPMGDLTPNDKLSTENRAKIEAALDLVFAPETHTTAMVIVHNGEIIGERYGEGAEMHTPHESWSMSKSLTAILYGRLTQIDGEFDPFRPAPFAAWKGDGDPRKEIQIADLFRMSSGLKFSSQGDDPATWDHAHPDNILVYTGAIDVLEFSVTRPLEHPPNTIGRYRQCDPLLIGKLLQQRLEAKGQSYLAFPQRELFDKLGIRHFILETDPHGNFISSGYAFGSGRDWARLGLLMLNEGIWQGERLLPKPFIDFVRTPAPVWPDENFGGLFLLNKNGKYALPKSVYVIAGAGGQHVFIVPSHKLVITRHGRQSGARFNEEALNKAFPLILAATEED